jgi:CDP-diacylglycerol--inositol 3-phosphatidyltransferase
MAKKTTAADVLLFYPNLIGYVRVLFMLLTFYFALSNWQVALVCYLLAFTGDVVDGHVARMFKQSSSFGATLDMVTDRVSTCGLLAYVGYLYPDYIFGFVFCIVLDIASHWFHMASVSGHHKSEESLKNRNALLRWYYSIYPLFGYCCVGCELFYVTLYALHFYPNPTLHALCFYGCLPACVLKNIVNVAQLCSAADAIAETDAENRKD